MISAISHHFPYFLVDLSTFITLLPLSILFYYESLTNKLHLRWDAPILGLSLSKEDYRTEMFKDGTRICCFVVWTLQLIFNMYIIYYHLTRPHHPKFYSTFKNKFALVVHMVGGVVAVNGLYIGAILNMKEICIAGAAAGAFLHLPATVWNNRQTHGQREMSTPTYFMTSYFLLKSYVHLALYDANFQTVFSCAMTLNIYAMVRFYYFLGRPYMANIEASYDRTLFFAGFSNASIAHGMFAPLFFLFGLYLWNAYFNFIKPHPKFLMRVERGYWDVIPDTMEKKRGTTFEEELQRQIDLGETKKTEAIAKALWFMIIGDDDKDMVDVENIKELYELWGMPDAESAAQTMFKKVDSDKSGRINFKEFKIGFKILIDGIHIIGEYEDLYRQRQRLQDNETKEGQMNKACKLATYPFHIE